MTYDEGVDLVRSILFDLICEGGGDSDTLELYAERIVSKFMEDES